MDFGDFLIMIGIGVLTLVIGLGYGLDYGSKRSHNYYICKKTFVEKNSKDYTKDEFECLKLIKYVEEYEND